MLIDLNDTAHDAPVVLKTGVPAGVAEHDVWGTVGSSLIGGVEESAKVRLNAQGVEVISADFKQEDPQRAFARIQPGLGDSIRCQTLETPIAVAQVKIVGVGLYRIVLPDALDSVEALLPRQIHRPQDHCIQHAKNDGVCANR